MELASFRAIAAMPTKSPCLMSARCALTMPSKAKSGASVTCSLAVARFDHQLLGIERLDLAADIGGRAIRSLLRAPERRGARKAPLRSRISGFLGLRLSWQGVCATARGVPIMNAVVACLRQRSLLSEPCRLCRGKLRRC